MREHIDGIHVVRTFIYPTQKAGLFPRLTNYFSFVLSSIIFGCFLLKSTDCILVESPPLFLGLAGLFLSKVKRARMIFNVSDLWPESAVRVGVLEENSFAYRISTSLEKFCYKHAWLITGQSKSILEDIRMRFPDQSTYHLSNGVDTGKFHPSKKTPEACEVIDDGRNCVVFYAGLHGLAQGLEQALAAAEQLRSEGQLKVCAHWQWPHERFFD